MADQASQMRSLRDVASQINSGGDLDTVLRDLIRAACEHGGWALGSIMAIDAPTARLMSSSGTIPPCCVGVSRTAGNWPPARP